MVKVRINDRESVQEAVRRFRKLVDRAGIKREMRRRAFFEKPSDARRREKIRSRFRAQIHQQQSR